MRRLIVFAIFMAVQTACGDKPTGPGTTTTTGGTTGNPNPAADFTVTNTPCVAPSAAPVSCTFNASATGLTGTPTFDWTFTNPANNQVVNRTGQAVSPEIGCSFSTGVVSFNISVLLRASVGTTSTTVTRTQAITRAAGACGT